jgi:tRNA(His) guanylyltransferase
MLDLGDRMKIYYENVTRHFLVHRTPVIIRIDGKSFHSWTRWAEKPYDAILGGYMHETLEYLVNNIQGAVFGFTQSDEISILVRDYDELETSMWFDGNIQKIASVSASFATAFFNSIKTSDLPLAFFDSRVFNIPKEEVCNYFIWRQQDIMRNSIQMMGQHHLGHKTIQGLSNQQVKVALENKNVDMNQYPHYFTYGVAYHKKIPASLMGVHVKDARVLDYNIPDFKDNREYVTQHVYLPDDTK